MNKIIPILIIILGQLAVTSMAAAARSGQQVYDAVCKTCHATGVSGAPKYGDKVWLVLMKKEGMHELVKDAIRGNRIMPARGGCADCSKEEVRAAVKYLVDSAGK